jgi:hypothetical protein
MVTPAHEKCVFSQRDQAGVFNDYCLMDVATFLKGV